MIQLFKKIRRKLLFEKRFSNYMAYAIGEILLVVIGILLALQFNNWNVAKENKTKERGYLINIVEDIEYQKKILKDMKRHSLESIVVAKSILKDYHTSQNFTTIDSLNNKLNFLIETYSFPNINNTYAELISSGQLNLIRQKELSLDIINYYLLSEESYVDVNNNIDNIFYPEVYPTIKKLCQISMYDEDVKEGETYLTQEFEHLDLLIKTRLQKTDVQLDLLNALKIRIQMLSMHTYLIDDLLKFAQELIQSVDDYLGLKPKDVNTYD